MNTYELIRLENNVNTVILFDCYTQELVVI